MENNYYVNLYVYTTIDSDGTESYSYPFSAIDDDSAVRMIAHNLAYAKFSQGMPYTLAHVYHIGTVEYVSSFTVSRSTPNDLSILLGHYEVSFDRDVFQRDFDHYLSFLAKLRNHKEETSHA